MRAQVEPGDRYRDDDSEKHSAGETDGRQPATEHDLRAGRQAIYPENLEQSNAPWADRRARLQPLDHVRDAAARVARFRPTLFHTGFYRKKNACLGREKTKSRRQDANDLSWDTVYAGVTTQNVWIGIETLAPEGVR